jgi:hypothetical protein
MDKAVFAAGFPGRLCEISVDSRRDWAFIPSPLPQDWEVPYDIWELLAQAREELARLDGVGRITTYFYAPYNAVKH